MAHSFHRLNLWSLCSTTRGLWQYSHDIIVITGTKKFFTCLRQTERWRHRQRGARTNVYLLEAHLLPLAGKKEQHKNYIIKYNNN